MSYGKYAQSIAANARELNNGSHTGGLASALSQGLSGWMMGKGMAEDRATKKAHRELTKQFYQTAQQALSPAQPAMPEPMTGRPDPLGVNHSKGRIARLMETPLPMQHKPTPLTKPLEEDPLTPQVGAPLMLAPEYPGDMPAQPQFAGLGPQGFGQGLQSASNAPPSMMTAGLDMSTSPYGNRGPQGQTRSFFNNPQRGYRRA
ncbi:MAG: hypothetical protein ACPGOY_10350 [Rhodospirillaceae bacterium]